MRNQPRCVRRSGAEASNHLLGLAFAELSADGGAVLTPRATEAITCLL